MSNQQILTLVDSPVMPPAEPGLVYLWNGYVDSDSQRSLFAHCEKNAERLREKYCGWVHDLGNFVTGGVRVVDRLGGKDDFSFWWMTSLFEKSPWKTPALNDAIRLLALEEILVEVKPGRVRLLSPNRRLHRSVAELCRRLGLAYEWSRLPSPAARPWTARRIYAALPQTIQAGLGLLRHVLVRWPFRRSDKSGWREGDRAVFFCSYFFNLEAGAAESGHFHSRYWEGLPGLMRAGGFSANWLQLYYPHAEVSRPARGLRWVSAFNRRRAQEGFHAFLDAYLSAKVVLHVLAGWLRLTWASWHLGGIKAAFRPRGSQCSFWFLLGRDWQASIRGAGAMNNLLWHELFDAALCHLPRQSRGFYLCENQGWERALVHAWRKNHHGHLVGVPHSTRSFWDLRFYYDARTGCPAAPHPLPRPDSIAANGRAALEAFRGENYAPAILEECEALRYAYLRDYRREPAGRRVQGGGPRVLVLGDYVSSATRRMLALLEAARPQLGDDFTLVAKPHPSCPIRAEDHPALGLQVVSQPLAGLLAGYDIAYTSNTTSAAVDAYLAGLPVIVMLDDAHLNFSPLRGRPGVRFVSSPEELAAAFHAAAEDGPRPEIDDFFFLDPALPRWTQLLTSRRAIGEKVLT